MASPRPGPWARLSVRLRTTLAAVLVVAVVLGFAAGALVLLVRDSLRDGVEASAEQRAAALVQQLETDGLPGRADEDDDTDGGDADEPEELVWQVRGEDGTVVAASQPGLPRLPTAGTEVTLPGADEPYLVVVEDAEISEVEYDVVVAASLEEVTDSTRALLAPLLVGVPLLLLLLAGTTWLVVGRALAPVERIRREVDQITGDRLDRRVPEPPTRDEVRRLATTMNRMLGRLEDSRARQQQFVADASHELRSPLAALRQTAEVAVAHPGALDDGELAEAVLEESIRMQRLVEQLLVLTRTEAGASGRPLGDVDLDDLLLTNARRLRRPELHVDTSGVGPARVHGDELALGQVVRNLLDNAARHARSRIALGLRAHDGGIELVVDDDGHGIAPADRERVFDRFVRLDEARARDDGGSGLGLAIVREIVAAHGGTVAVEEAPLGGARFVVRLPAPARAS
ncbi:HAMP domain-containing histidine kinase [Nocardioides sp. zg-536]|uniref:histidine kinase n=1 Tax=Nocardioides faecalis TaxID=2803858 RepID=A0A938XZ62_9ACTN|nr:HAMP domain-containing sensor histidine kinase [Nocardioides faecalis]MBM9458896.1 HAMP domain-containing histidine kinase [Nocardioides faecalis]QVI60299.1 HAMP domain-containing histidine kinase [Nocardioides faecalis]